MNLKKILKIAAVTLAGIILNMAGRYAAQMLELPIWFDMMGTVLASYFGGVWSGVFAGISSNIILVFSYPEAIFYAVTNVVAAVVIHLFIKKGYFESVIKTIIASFWLGIICAFISTPLNIMIGDGYSGNIWGDTLVDMLRWYDVSLKASALAGEMIVEILDKQVCMLLALLIIHIISKLKKNKSAPKQTLPVILAVCIFYGAVICPMDVSAEDADVLDDNFVEEIYDNTNGMVSSEANVICETEDGHIWIGSYAGLSRYDGNQFEFIREGGLVNVVSMMEDSRGRLWIGTNDAGIARYEDGKYTYFKQEDGLPTNSVRCFAEDEDGTVYVGTSGKICRFDPDDNIDVLSHNINFTVDMAIYDGKLFVIDNNGGLYAIDGDQPMTMTNSDYFFYCLAGTSDGLLVGTETGELFTAAISDGSIALSKENDVSADKISAVFEDSRGHIWIALGSGLGYIDCDGQYYPMSIDGFDESIYNIYEDYQGNVWFTSTHYGVMKLAESPFVNAFERIGAESQVVNAVAMYRGNYFCGTDKGMVVFNKSGLNSEYDVLEEMTEGSRVRCIYTDSADGLWICTYNGLINYTAEGEIKQYNTGNCGVTSDRFRCIAELSDGTFAIGTADGINFIKDDRLAGTITGEDGMGNTQILSIAEGYDGSVWAGSDGSGIYVINDGRITEKYSTENGLPSDVILRIIPCGNKYLVVTSNSLCCIDKSGRIKKLESFPYFNNYDIMLRDDTAYVTCSAGLYEIKLDDLLDDDCSRIRLYSAGEGLFSGLTANSWNYISENGELYLCSNSGVMVFNRNAVNNDTDMKYGIVSLECDDEIIIPADDTFNIPDNAKNISVYATVRNYAFTDVKVRFFVRELDEDPKLYNWNEIEPVRMYKPENGEYHICLQVLDSSGGKVLQETVYTVKTDVKPWGTSKYRAYLVVVCTDIMLSMIISIVSLILIILRKNELETLRGQLENTIGKQTDELIMQQKEMKSLLIQTVTALSEAVDAKDRYTSGHSRRVAEYSRMIAERMGKSREEQEEIYRAGLLHDIGKIRIPVEIINKSSKLTDEEYNIIKIHSITGYNILRGISGNKLIALCAKYHHERYDGKGYPNGLAGDKIPEAARILGVADSYDAMTSTRSYRKALPQAVVRGEIEKGRGTQFDPEIADIMLEMIDEDKNYTMKQADEIHRSVLIVDDEIINHKLITNIMSDEPAYKIVSVCSGMDALKALEKMSFDLILLDVRMPGMDGIETLKAIREHYNIPVVFMTSDKEFEMAGKFAELGCDDYITKPFLPLLIKEIIHNMTERTTIE
ncbi:MAG: HD domain-containing phosphohydrolase [Oscillospiraceae bacterium]